jgi:hypothetical protein
LSPSAPVTGAAGCKPHRVLRHDHRRRGCRCDLSFCLVGRLTVGVTREACVYGWACVLWATQRNQAPTRTACHTRKKENHTHTRARAHTYTHTPKRARHAARRADRDGAVRALRAQDSRKLPCPGETALCLRCRVRLRFVFSPANPPSGRSSCGCGGLTNTPRSTDTCAPLN